MAALMSALLDPRPFVTTADYASAVASLLGRELTADERRGALRAFVRQAV